MCYSFTTFYVNPNDVKCKLVLSCKDKSYDDIADQLYYVGVDGDVPTCFSQIIEYAYVNYGYLFPGFTAEVTPITTP